MQVVVPINAGKAHIAGVREVMADKGVEIHLVVVVSTIFQSPASLTRQIGFGDI